MTLAVLEVAHVKHTCANKARVVSYLTHATSPLPVSISRFQGDPSIACDVVGIVLKELRREGLGVPVLVAVDVYNAWMPSVFPKFLDFESRAPVTRERASLIRHFLKVRRTELSRPSTNHGTEALCDILGGHSRVTETLEQPTFHHSCCWLVYPSSVAACPDGLKHSVL
jgi:hypothetical protein